MPRPACAAGLGARLCVHGMHPCFSLFADSCAQGCMGYSGSVMSGHVCNYLDAQPWLQSGCMWCATHVIVSAISPSIVVFGKEASVAGELPTAPPCAEILAHIRVCLQGYTRIGMLLLSCPHAGTPRLCLEWWSSPLHCWPHISTTSSPLASVVVSSCVRCASGPTRARDCSAWRAIS